MSAAEPLPAEEPSEIAVEVEAPERVHLELVEDEESESERGRVAVMASELRPYLPTRAQLAVSFAGVGAGTRVLIGHGWTWLGKDGWIWDGLTKVGAVAGGCVVGLPAVWQAVATVTGPYAPFVPTVAVVCGCVAAKRYAPKTEKAKKKPASVIEDQDADEAAEAESAEEDADEVIGAEDVAQLVRDVAARHKHQGVHLEDLLTEPLFEGWEKAELKAALTDDWALPVESFKLIFQTPEGKRQRNREGVRLRHLPQTPAGRVGEGPVRGLAVVPSQPPAEGGSSTLPEAPVEGSAGGAATALPRGCVGASPRGSGRSA
ncbi:hypothetical protein [Streptomyces graminilatus]|uniref:hypothetical protein n=1 Tax=Streptomyces graminilatus TaxID=1464070 RepID=UPI0006E3E9C5|nr:hypothetical protein [Streptomyces graminilatus]